MTRTAKDFIDRTGRRVLTKDGKPGRDGVEGVGLTTEQLQGHVAAALLATGGQLNDAQLDEIIGWVAAYKSRPSTWILFEHEDGRMAVAREGAATFTHNEPKWVRVHPVDVHGAVDADGATTPAGAFMSTAGGTGHSTVATMAARLSRNRLSPKEQDALQALLRANAASQVAREQLVNAGDACAEADYGSNVRAGLKDASTALDQATASLDFIIKMVTE